MILSLQTWISCAFPIFPNIVENLSKHVYFKLAYRVEAEVKPNFKQFTLALCQTRV